MLRKENYIYVGIDLHKETHTAVILNCWNEKLDEITFDNKPSEFNKLTKKVAKHCKNELQAVLDWKMPMVMEEVLLYGLLNMAAW